MPTAPLHTVTRTQGNNRALKAGEVVPAGISLEFEEVPVLVKAFRRMVRERAYDVCEMALTTYLTAREHGAAFTALPVFLVRGLHHGAIQVRDDGSVSEPAALTGRRVGVSRGYTVTTGVWARAIMALEYGLDLDSVTWVLSGDEHVAAYVPPGNVVSAGGGDLGELLLAGELDAVVGAGLDLPGVVGLIDDPVAAGLAALRDRGLWPINHLVVVADDVLAAHPDVGAALFEAFAESKRRYLPGLRRDGIANGGIATPELDAADLTYRRVMETTGVEDPLPYGLEANRAVLELLIEQATAQHILREPVALESVFDPATLALSG